MIYQLIPRYGHPDDLEIYAPPDRRDIMFGIGPGRLIKTTRPKYFKYKAAIRAYYKVQEELKELLTSPDVIVKPRRAYSDEGQLELHLEDNKTAPGQQTELPI